MYRQLLDQMHPRGDIPLDVRSAIERMEGTLAQLPQLRTQLHSSARSLTTQEDEVRATRLRIGRALDELVSEESKLARQLDAGKRERGLAEGALRDTVRALATRAPSPLPRKRPGETLSSEDVQQLDALHTQLSALAEADAHLTRVQKEMEQRRLAWDDLRFQVAQLKGRLATLNAESSVVQGHTQERVQKSEVELRAATDRLVSDAERVATHLRTRPELANALAQRRL
jgi:hypothetical protein